MYLIPRLTADDICHRRFHYMNASCLSGHICKVMGVEGENLNKAWRSEIYKKLLTYINEHSTIHYPQVCDYNDDKTGYDCALTWNRCFAKEISQAHRGTSNGH